MSFTPNAEKVRKTRNRIPTSCEPCRKKKMKCDRQKPCSSCVKNNSESSCRYAAHQSEGAKNVQLTNEIIRLKMRVNKLEKVLQLNNIDMTPYNDLSIVLNNPSTGSSAFEDNEDPVISLSAKFDKLVFKENHIIHAASTCYMTLISGDSELSVIFGKYFNKHNKEYQYYLDSQKIKVNADSVNMLEDTPKMPISVVTSNVDACSAAALQDTDNSMLATSSSESQAMFSKVLDILEKINNILPPMFVIQALIDNFFDHVYYLLPYIDETVFREELTYVLTSDRRGRPKLILTHVQNASIVSLLLLVLRFSYLAVNIKDFAEDVSLIENENLAMMIKANICIDEEFVGMAKNLILSMPGSDSMFKKVTIRIVQVFLYLKLYNCYSPELNDESQESSIAICILSQMTRIIGGNRDPDMFPNLFKDDTSKNIWRRIYYKILYLDATNSFQFGSPLIIADEYDVKLPSLNKSTSKLVDDFNKGLPVDITGKDLKKVIIEKCINNDVALEYEAIKLFREAMKLCNSLDGNIKKSAFQALIRRTETFLNTRIPATYDLFDLSDLQGTLRVEDPLERIFNIPKVKKLEIRIMLASLICTLNYLLYLNEDESNYRACIELAVQATEYSLIQFKIVYDYCVYACETETLHGHTSRHQKFKKFSHKLDLFILKRINSEFQKSNLWIASIFLKNFTTSSLKFEVVLREMSNTTDSVAVLNWLNVDLGSNYSNDQFLVLLFHYIKEYYFISSSLKTTCFPCWRNSTLIKIFINYFKNSNEQQFRRFLLSPPDKMQFQTMANDNSVTPGEKSEMDDDINDEHEDTIETKRLEKLINDLDVMKELNLPAGNMEDLVYDNEDSLLKALEEDSNEFTKYAKGYELFNFGLYSHPDQYPASQQNVLKSQNALNQFGQFNLDTQADRDPSTAWSTSTGPSPHDLKHNGTSFSSSTSGSRNDFQYDSLHRVRTSGSHSSAVTPLSSIGYNNSSSNGNIVQKPFSGSYVGFMGLDKIGDGSLIDTIGSIDSPGANSTGFTPGGTDRDINLEQLVSQIDKDPIFKPSQR